MVLNQRPDRQRSGRSNGVNAVQADVLREETRQLNVALPVELHHRLKVAAAQEGISVQGMDRPGGALLLCKCSYIGTYLCRKPNRAESARIGQSNVSACIDSDRPMEVPAADCGEAP